MLNRIILISIAIVLLLFSSLPQVVAGGKELKIPLPSLAPPMSSDQCRCESLINAAVFADTLSQKNIVGTLSKGTDEISIEIKGNILYFLSGASFKQGGARPAEFRVVHNTNEQILAICSQETGNGYTVDIFALNKKTGIAVWTKTRSYDLFSGGHPLGYCIYLKCK
jgi:hypothetical protein